MKITSAEFMAEPQRFIGLDEPLEITNDSGESYIFVAARPRPRKRPAWLMAARMMLARIVDKFRPRIKGPLDTSWIE